MDFNYTASFLMRKTVVHGCRLGRQANSTNKYGTTAIVFVWFQCAFNEKPRLCYESFRLEGVLFLFGLIVYLYPFNINYYEKRIFSSFGF